MSAPPGTRAKLLLADYIGVDAGGKINALGEGFAITGIQPTGTTAPQYLAAVIDYPSSMAGRNSAIVLELRDETTDSVVMAPGPSGQVDAIRIQQMVSVQRPQVPGVYLPDDLPCRVQAMLGFPAGLPLTAGHRYAWKLEIDGTRFKGWSAHFYVAGPPPTVVGGPGGPSDIPHIDLPHQELDDEPEDAPPSPT